MRLLVGNDSLDSVRVGFMHSSTFRERYGPVPEGRVAVCVMLAAADDGNAPSSTDGTVMAYSNVERSLVWPADVLAAHCAACFKAPSECADGKLLQCTRCKRSRYCSRECQRTDYPDHKPFCGAVLFAPSSSSDT